MDENQIATIIKEMQRNNHYPGPEKLMKLMAISNPEISRAEIKTFLSKDVGTQLTKVQHQKHTDGHITATQPYEFWQFDIFDLSRYRAKNDDYRYLMASVDVFTRMAWVEPMKNKDSENCAEAFDKILGRSGGTPRSMISDQDRAFIQGPFLDLMDKKKIALTTNALKDHRALGIIDNFAKRIKDVLTKTFIRVKDVKWLGIIQEIVNRYNKATHSSLNVVENLNEYKQGADPKYKELSPNEANLKENYENVLDINMKKNTFNKTVSDLIVGDKVRKVVVKSGIVKGTDPRWSDEVWVVVKIKGSTITLNDESVMKRTDLLKIPASSTYEGGNVVSEQKKTNAKETQKENQAKDAAYKEKKAKDTPVIHVIPIGGSSSSSSTAPAPVAAPKPKLSKKEMFAAMRYTHGQNEPGVKKKKDDK